MQGMSFGSRDSGAKTAMGIHKRRLTAKMLAAATFTSEGASTMSGVTTATEVGEKLAKELSKY